MISILLTGSQQITPSSMVVSVLPFVNFGVCGKVVLYWHKYRYSRYSTTMHRNLTKGSRVGWWSRNRWTETSIGLVTVSKERKWKSPFLCGTYRPPPRTADRPPMLLPSLTNFVFTFSTIFLLVDVSRRPISPLHSTLNFRLHHFHAVTPSAHVYFADVPIHSSLHANSQPLSIPISPRADGTPTICRVAETRTLSTRGQSAMLDWEVDQIPWMSQSQRHCSLSEK